MSSFDWSVVYGSTLRRRLRILSPADCDDAIQDACVKLLRKSAVPTLALLHRTILNSNKDRIKAESRRKTHEQLHAVIDVDEGSDRPDAESHSHDVRMPQAQHCDATEHDPAARLERREMRTAIKRAVRAARLAQDHRCALWAWLRDRVAEFARQRGIPEVTVRVWAKRARDALRPHLEREGLGLR
ncbi:MAG: hypothetical protein MUC88_17055 [Planctomycetes bacterium]|jgi:DNA-directed RNA polymerase specialized sigma24 family protein|nr:hypothetical protein [Planctomycetota bacterium]